MLINRGSKLLLLFVMALTLTVGCDSSSDGGNGGGGGGGGTNNDVLIRSIIDNYVDNVVICTYELLFERSQELEDAIAALQANPTDENLEAAREAWVAVRRPWEQSEAWLFGPVDTKGHDPALDTWPVDQTQLQGVLDGPNDLTPQFIRSVDPALKGFHTAEFLLFDFEADELGDREFEYLISVVGDIRITAEELFTDWTEGDGDQFPEPFGELMKSAGPGNGSFPSLVTALQQIIEGQRIILAEVGEGKIADPFDTGDVTSVESPFSFNSLIDFSNNIQGVLNVFLGDQNELGKFGDGLVDLLDIEDPVLSNRLENEINAAIDAILAIPAPFRDAINDPDAADEIEAAIEAVLTIEATLANDVLPVVNAQ